MADNEASEAVPDEDCRPTPGRHHVNYAIYVILKGDRRQRARITASPRKVGRVDLMSGGNQ